MSTCYIEKSKINKNISFRCTYEVKVIDSDIQIINNTNGKYINEEIKSKIKIINEGKKEKLVLKKKFNNIGEKIIDFIIEEKLYNMSYMFYKCSNLKSIDFISIETEQVIEMGLMFAGCNELEYLDLSNFNTSKVVNMDRMFLGCYSMKEIKGINNFNTINVKKMRAMFAG